jgi:hypothetical protein
VRGLSRPQAIAAAVFVVALVGRGPDVEVLGGLPSPLPLVLGAAVVGLAAGALALLDGRAMAIALGLGFAFGLVYALEQTGGRVDSSTATDLLRALASEFARTLPEAMLIALALLGLGELVLNRSWASGS